MLGQGLLYFFLHSVAWSAFNNLCFGYILYSVFGPLHFQWMEVLSGKLTLQWTPACGGYTSWLRSHFKFSLSCLFPQLNFLTHVGISWPQQHVLNVLKSPFSVSSALFSYSAAFLQPPPGLLWGIPLGARINAFSSPPPLPPPSPPLPSSLPPSPLSPPPLCFLLVIYYKIKKKSARVTKPEPCSQEVEDG